MKWVGVSEVVKRLVKVKWWVKNCCGQDGKVEVSFRKVS